MFHSSTQRSYWIFSDSNELKKLREKANADYITRMKLDKVINSKYEVIRKL